MEGDQADLGARRGTAGVRAWKLEDAKARFSELVRRAQTEGPQRVTVRGKDAVVVVSADDFERLMTGDRDIVRGSMDTVSDWRLTRPADVPGQAIGQADYVLIAEIVEVERFEQQASEHVQRFADDLEHLVSSRGMLVVRPVL